MSKLALIKKNLKSGALLGMLPALAAEYDTYIEELPEKLSMKGKSLEEVNKEQCAHLSRYDELKAELKIIVEFLETWVQHRRGQMYETIVNNNGRDLSDRAIDKIIDGKDEYLNAQEIYLEIKEIYEKFSAAVRAFEQRGYSLKNITDLRVHQLNREII